MPRPSRPRRPTPAACDLTKPFGAPVAITELDTTTLQSEPRLTSDELTLFYWTAPPGGAELAVATRTSTASPFMAPSLLTNIHTSGHNDVEPSPTGDGLTLYFASDRAGQGRFEIWYASRPSATEAFGAPTPLANVDTPDADEFTPYVMPDDLTLYFARGVEYRRIGDLFVTRRAATNTSFGVADSTLFTAIDESTSDEQNPVVSLDGLTLYFASDRTVDGVGAHFHIWKATRASTAEPFGAPTEVTELADQGYHQYPGWLSGDGCRLYFDDDATYSWNLYVATKPK